LAGAAGAAGPADAAGARAGGAAASIFTSAEALFWAQAGGVKQASALDRATIEKILDIDI